MAEIKSGNTYLSRYSLALAGLKTIERNELLSIEILTKSLLELLYIGMVNRLEAYIQDRLYEEAFSSVEKTVKYVKYYNIKNPHKKLYKRPPFNDKTLRDIEATVLNHVYHRIDLMFEYFEFISGFNGANCSMTPKVTDMLKIRNALIHKNGILDNGKKVVLSFTDVENACECIKTFIEEVETEFQRIGCHWLIDLHPDE